MDSKFYDSLTPEQKKIADEINKEFAEKYEELRKKAASVEKIEKESKKICTITKNQIARNCVGNGNCVIGFI